MQTFLLTYKSFLARSLILMKYFIGIVPPAEISEVVVNIQQRFGDNRLEPHITLRPPVTVINEPEWLNMIEETCRSFSPIPVALTGTGHFGKGVLFIDVKSPDLAKLHYSILEVLMPFEPPETRQQKKSFNPHLTLGRLWCGFTQQHFVEMKKLADKYLSAQPISFIATFVRIYYKPHGQSRYQTLRNIPLV